MKLELITVLPDEALHKEYFIIKDQNILNILESVDVNEKFCNFQDTVDRANSSDPVLHQTCFLHLVTETVFDYPHNCFGEKTWKPIVNLRPFIIVSVPGSLANLHSLGFKTFSNWWDESYDTIQDPLQRMLSIVNLTKEICQKSLVDLQKIYHDMKPTLKYNYDHYYGNFISDALNNFEQACQKNLLPR